MGGDDAELLVEVPEPEDVEDALGAVLEPQLDARAGRGLLAGLDEREVELRGLADLALERLETREELALAVARALVLEVLGEVPELLGLLDLAAVAREERSPNSLASWISRRLRGSSSERRRSSCAFRSRRARAEAALGGGTAIAR